MKIRATNYAADPVLIVSRRLDTPRIRMVARWMVLRLLRHAVLLEVEARESRKEVAALRMELDRLVNALADARAVIDVLSHGGMVREAHMTDGGEAWKRWERVRE